MSGDGRAACFLVLGQPRSGTTLVAQCLTGHPDLVIPDESDLVIPLAFLCDRVRDADLGRALAADLIVGTERFGISIGQYLTEAETRAAVGEAPWSTAGVLTSVYAAVAAAAGARVAGDKSPNDLQFARILAKTGVFDGEIPIVHVVRDVRDVIVSVGDLGWGSGPRYGLARNWAANNLRLREAVLQKGGPYLPVRYEDVVHHPEAEFERLCAFLGIEFDAAMLSERSRYAQYAGHAPIGQHDRTFEPITTSRVGRFEDELDPDALAEVSRIAADALTTFGYLEEPDARGRPRRRRPWHRAG